MEFFEKYVSNTYAGSGNQLFFETDGSKIHTGRLFYKISVGGKFSYSLLFSNIIDSTFSDGFVSHKNLICREWKIHSMRIGKCRNIEFSENIEEVSMEGENPDVVVSDFKDILFDGKASKNVMPGEFFSTDPVELEFEKGEFLCLEITFSGRMLPYHEESMLPVFIKDGEKWKYSKFMPFAGMIGCERKPKARIVYFGDSITQGIGVAPNSYLHWNAVLSEKLGSGYSYWNLGIGYGRANDAASGGAWMYKAMHSDIVFVCFGVNDIKQGQSEEQIKKDLHCIADTLKKAGKKVIFQTVPPFDYEGENIEKWQRINAFILTEIKNKVDFVFDNNEYLGEKGALYIAKYGRHPDEKGCRIWAEAFYEKLKEEKVL